MILEKLHLLHLGPFYDIDINIEPNITVLTGPNDSGKSQLLKFIAYTYNKQLTEEKDINIQYFRTVDNQVDQDDNILVESFFNVENDVREYFSGKVANVKPNDTVLIKSKLNKSSQDRDICLHPRTGVNLRLRKFPKVIWIDEDIEMIDSIISFDQVSPLQNQLLTYAFGLEYAAKLTQANNELYLHQILRDGASSLSTEISKTYGTNINLNFSKLNEREIGIYVSDPQGYETPIGYRGTGMRKILTLLTLLGFNQSEEYTIILYDEPETSLHADSQHYLRRFLEELSENKSMQIIYSTHSPMMLNTFYPKRIRLLERKKRNDYSETIIHDDFLHENFFPVIRSLGLTLADSLMIAPITIIVEGKTEEQNLGLILKKLFDDKILGFEKVDLVSSSSLIFNGEGDSFDKWVKIIEQQGGIPVVLLDGDKTKRIKQLTANGKIKREAIFDLEEEREIEDILPLENYLEALRSVLSIEGDVDSLNNWFEEVPEEDKIKYHLTSKKILGWLRSKGVEDYKKTEVFSVALENTPADQFLEVIVNRLRDMVQYCVDMLD